MQKIATLNDDEEFTLKGGIKLNFRLSKPVVIQNVVEVIKGHKETFTTTFKFSTKVVLILAASNRQTTRDIVQKLCEKFRLLDDGRHFDLYEREIAMKTQEVFYRRLEVWEKPLELNFVWSLNKERKSLVFADHDPNESLLAKIDLDDLEKRLQTLDLEEEAEMNLIEEKYDRIKRVVKNLMN